MRTVIINIFDVAVFINRACAVNIVDISIVIVINTIIWNFVFVDRNKVSKEGVTQMNSCVDNCNESRCYSNIGNNIVGGRTCA